MSDVKKVVADIGPSLGGVFHAAAVLQDAMIQSMTLKQLQMCLRTKCGGAQNLHDATIASGLDFFARSHRYLLSAGIRGRLPMRQRMPIWVPRCDGVAKGALLQKTSISGRA